MIKRCSACNSEYWDRWRNTPHTLCLECAVGNFVCVHCARLERRAPDPHQLALWPGLNLGPRKFTPPEISEHYVEHSHKASQATRRRYPFQ